MDHHAGQSNVAILGWLGAQLCADGNIAAENSQVRVERVTAADNCFSGFGFRTTDSTLRVTFLLELRL